MEINISKQLSLFGHSIINLISFFFNDSSIIINRIFLKSLIFEFFCISITRFHRKRLRGSFMIWEYDNYFDKHFYMFLIIAKNKKILKLSIWCLIAQLVNISEVEYKCWSIINDNKDWYIIMQNNWKTNFCWHYNSKKFSIVVIII